MASVSGVELLVDEKRQGLHLCLLPSPKTHNYMLRKNQKSIRETHHEAHAAKHMSSTLSYCQV